MRKLILEPFIFLAVSGLVIFLLFLHPSYTVLQVLSIVILLGITFIFSTKSNVKGSIFSSKRYYYFLFFTTAFIELLVISTGGSSSHFLLVAFLFALTLSFFIDVTSSIAFLASFFIVITTQLFLDKNLFTLITADPTNTILFCITFFISGTLTYYINRYYHFKDTLLEVLKKQIILQDIHEKSILRHIQELIIITDKNLHIISVNEAAEKSLLLPKADLLQKAIFEVLFLLQENNQILTKDNFPLQKILDEKSTLTLEHLSLVSKNTSHSSSLALIAKPILDLEGKVDQLIFIIQQEASLSSQSENLLLDQVITKHKAMIEDVRRALISKGLRDLAFKTEVIGKIDREIRHLIRLENDTVDSLSASVNLANVCKSVCLAMKDFAQALHISPVFTIQNEEDERKQIDIASTEHAFEEATGTFFETEINLKWFDVLLHKLMEIVILLSSSTQNPEVVLLLQKVKGKLVITLKSNYSELTTEDIPSLFSLNYNNLSSKTNLHLASGLEGMIAERIAKKMQLPIKTAITEYGLEFIIMLKAHLTAAESQTNP